VGSRPRGANAEPQAIARGWPRALTRGRNTKAVGRTQLRRDGSRRNGLSYLVLMRGL